MASGSAGSNKNRKVGRNANYCKMYSLSHRYERNKAKKLKRHLKRFPGDVCASARLKELAAYA